MVFPEKMVMISPATEGYISKADHFEIDKRIVAVSSDAADNIWLAVSGGKDEVCALVFFEADERSLAILKGINPYSFIKGEQKKS